MILYSPVAASSPTLSKHLFSGRGGTHYGIDYQVKTGTEVNAAASGTVVRAAIHEKYGYLIIIDNGIDECGLHVYSLYAHLSSYSVGLGDTVTQGQKIGASGGEIGAPGSGNAEGPHLHYEVITSPTKLNWNTEGGTGYQGHAFRVDPLGYPPPTCFSPLPNLPRYSPVIPRRDPLILDLDGDGIETVGSDAGVYFDHDGNGFSEATGWANSDDGLLVWDRNGDGIINDGKELFGDQTPLKNGARAANGFQVLSEYDDNHDGKIDTQDAIWANLKIWRDEGYEGPDGYSQSEDINELHTLDEFGITAINLDSIITNIPDGQGNTQTRLGNFVKADGTTGALGEYVFARNTQDTVYEWLSVPSDIATLPKAEGAGNVPNLHQAIVRDPTGQLKSLVESFVAEANPANRATLLQQILYKWSGVDGVAVNSRGAQMDGRKVAFLERLYGQTLPNPDSGLAVLWEGVFREISESYYGQLMAQSHLSDLFGLITYTFDAQKQDSVGDLTAALTQLQTELANNPDAGKLRLSEFARSLRGLGLYTPGGEDTVNYLSFRETFLELDPTLGWLIDSAGLPPYTPTNYYGHFIGTNQTEAMQTSLTQGDGVLNGYSGNDVMYGSDRLTGPYGGEWFFQELGNATIVGAGGPDIIWAGEGNDLLDGGPGNDTLAGEAGSDTYIFRIGSGQDVIKESTGYGAAGALTDLDTIWLGSHLTPADVTLRRLGNNLMLAILNTPDTLTVQDYFRIDSPLNRIERIQFQDGTVWTDTEILQTTFLPTAGNDVIYGTTGDDVLSGLTGNDSLHGQAGNDTLEGNEDNDWLDGGTGNDILRGGSGADTLYGGEGNDQLEGGTGNDTLNGGAGNDTYLYARGGGQDILTDSGVTIGNFSAVWKKPLCSSRQYYRPIHGQLVL